jgi:TRAP-type C4-dicarboxylate transport system substrate-binding protein
MIKKLKKIFMLKPQKQDFSSLFNDASPEERRRILEDAARKANQDQRDLVKQYEQANQKPA